MKTKLLYRAVELITKHTHTDTHTSLNNKFELDLASYTDSWRGALKKTGVEMSSARKDYLRCSPRCAASRWMEITHLEKKMKKIWTEFKTWTEFSTQRAMACF